VTRNSGFMTRNSGNFTFVRHIFCVTVKWLKSVYIYGSYRKIKPGFRFFETLCKYFNCLSLKEISTSGIDSVRYASHVNQSASSK